MRSVRVGVLTYLVLAGGCSWSGSKPGEETGSGGSGSGGLTGSGGVGSGGAGGGPNDGSGGLTGSGGARENDGSVDMTDPDAPTCGMQTFPLESTPPDLLLVLDHSGSMAELPDGSVCPAPATPACVAQQRWSQVTAAINEVVMKTDTTIRWGLKFFPDSTATCGAAAAPVVPIGDKKASDIAAAIAANPAVYLAGSTPTTVAMTTATTYMTGLVETNPKYIVLATDGLPNCGDGTTPATTAAIAAVKDTASKGIPVFVIGIATAGGGADTTLNMMAEAGGRPDTTGTSKYYPVTSSTQLVTTLQAIQRKIFSCEFKLTKVPPFPDKVSVKGDGMAIPKSASNGWDYTAGMTSIMLTGKWCTDVMDGVVKDVETIYGCVIPELP